MLTINYEHPSSADNFDSKSQTKISPSDQSFEKQEEEWIEFKEWHHDELRRFSSVIIQNGVINVTSDYPYSAYHFESKPQAKISPSEKSIKKPEEELTPFEKYLE